MARKPEVIIFDVGDTLIHLAGYDRLAGVRALLDYAIEGSDREPEAIAAYGEDLDSDLEARCAPNHLEYSQQAYHRLLYGRFGVRFDLSDAALELLYWQRALSFEAEPRILEALTAVHERGQRMAVISNTTFSANVIETELAEQGMGDFFDLVLTSADLGIRKPDPKIFETAAGLLGVDPEVCWYVGNSSYFDVHGAASAKMRPVWYNRDGRIESLPDDTAVIGRWDELPSLVIDARR